MKTMQMNLKFNSINMYKERERQRKKKEIIIKKIYYFDLHNFVDNFFNF